MNKFFYSLSLTMLALAAAPTARAQGVGIGTGASAPAASAALEVKSTTQGMLVPRMTQAQRNGIAAPATSLMVYQTDGTAGFYYYDGAAWASLNGAALPSQAGNSGKVLTTDGTTTSWTAYNKETFTVLQIPRTSSTGVVGAGTGTYTVPAFTNGVTTQIIIVVGLTSQPYDVVLPNPVGVPDGSRVLIKKFADGDQSAGVVRLPYTYATPFTNAPTVATFDGVTGNGAPMYAYLGDGNNTTGNGVPYRFGTMFVKVTHQNLLNAVTPTVYHSWVPILGFSESRTQ